MDDDAPTKLSDYENLDALIRAHEARRRDPDDGPDRGRDAGGGDPDGGDEPDFPLELTPERAEDVIDSLDKLRGRPPYDEGFNPCYRDAHLAESLRRRYGYDSLRVLEVKARGVLEDD